MPEQKVEAYVEGGKATAAPPLGPALGPLGVNIGKVISDINKKTEAFKGMQVPIKIIVNDKKEVTITVGTPPVSSLLKSEAKIEKGSGNPLTDKVANIRIENINKVIKMKQDALLGKGQVNMAKEVLGTCVSMGILIEGKDPKEMLKLVDKEPYKSKILSGKSELSAEELRAIEEEKKKLQQDIERRKAEYIELAKKIVEELKGKPRAEIKAKFIEAKIPSEIYDEYLPTDTKAAAAAAGAPGAPAAGAAPAKEAKK